MDISTKITKRRRKRKLKSGALVLHDRYVLNYRDPKSGQAPAGVLRTEEGSRGAAARAASPRSPRTPMSTSGRRRPSPRPSTTGSPTRTATSRPPPSMGYKVVCQVIRGPLLIGTRQAAGGVHGRPARSRRAPASCRMLGDIKLTELTTADIRAWHRELVEHCGTYTANRAKSHLKSILALAEEDFGVRAPSMPTGLGRARHKPKKAILTPDAIQAVIAAAKARPGMRASTTPSRSSPARGRASSSACCGRTSTSTRTSSASAASRSATARSPR